MPPDVTKPLPSNPQREKQVIGAILGMPHGDSRTRILAESLPVDAFYDSSTGKAWGLIRKLVADETLDALSFIENCETSGLGHDIAAEFTASIQTPSPANLEKWAQELRNLAHYRRIITQTSAVQSLAFDASGDPIELEETLRLAGIRNITDLAPGTQPGTAIPAKKFDDFCEKLAEVRRKGSPLRFGIREIDYGITWIPSYGVILARTTHGKTAFIATVAWHMALAGKAPVVFSLEQPDYQFFMRLVSLSIRGGFGAAVGRNHEYLQKRKQAMEILKSTKLTIIGGRRTVESIHAEAARLKSKGMCDAILIDQLSRIDHRQGQKETKEQAMTRSSNRLAQVWADLDTPLVLLAQLNKKTPGRDQANQAPRPSDIKDCASVLEDSCWQFMIDRVEADLDRAQAAEKAIRKAMEKGDSSGAAEHHYEGFMNIHCTKDRNATMGGIWTKAVPFDKECGHVGKWYFDPNEPLEQDDREI